MIVDGYLFLNEYRCQENDCINKWRREIYSRTVCCFHDEQKLAYRQSIDWYKNDILSLWEIRCIRWSAAGKTGWVETQQIL